MSVFALAPNDAGGDDVYLTYVTHERGVEDIECYLGWVDRLPIVGKGVRQPSFFKWAQHYGPARPLTAAEQEQAKRLPAHAEECCDKTSCCK